MNISDIPLDEGRKLYSNDPFTFSFSSMTIADLDKDQYHAYYQPYIDTVGNADLLETLQKQMVNFPKFIEAVPEARWHYAYGSDKWTIAQVLLHLLDAERIFQYRALRFARGDKTPLTGFDQDVYVPNSGAERRTPQDVIEEYKAIRKATITLFTSFQEADFFKAGMASDSNMSVLALGFIICGHQRHHRNIIRERYL